MATDAPLMVVLVKLLGRPRMAMLRPSPFTSRLSWMPGTRASDSAMLVSGNLPMSSAKIESVKPVESRLASVEYCRLWRKPFTTTLSRSVTCSAGAACCPACAWAVASCSCAMAPVAAMPRIAALNARDSVVLAIRACTVLPSRFW